MTMKNLVRFLADSGPNFGIFPLFQAYCCSEEQNPRNGLSSIMCKTFHFISYELKVIFRGKIYILPIMPCDKLFLSNCYKSLI